MIRRLLLALLLGPAAQAWGAGLEISPILVEIPAKTPRASVVVRNPSGAPVRLELTAHAWQQSAAGEMVLAPAPGLVVFPPLLELPPGGERKIRISATGGFGATEGSYRLFVNELPPGTRPTERADKPGIRFLTRVGIPVFLLPQKKRLRLEWAGAAMKGSHLSFQLRNVGNTRLSPTKVKVEGLDAAGKAVFSREVDTWYVLAGGLRDFDVAVPAGDCAKVRKLTVELTAQKIPVRTGVETPGGACGP